MIRFFRKRERKATKEIETIGATATIIFAGRNPMVDRKNMTVAWKIPSRIELRAKVPLQMKFFWGDEELEPAPKSCEEIEMDKLWSKMEASIRVREDDSPGEVGSLEPQVNVKNE